jgi:myo-inositol-1-phosphate synthase
MNTEQDILLDEKIDSLLKEFDDHREAIKIMVADLERLKLRIDTILPETLDNRYIRFFEEKIKAVTAFFSALLEMRKEIVKSVKDEIEIRRRLRKSDDELDVESMLDIRNLATKVKDFQAEKEKLVSKRIKETQQETLEGIEIPGINVKLEDNKNDRK